MNKKRVILGCLALGMLLLGLILYLLLNKDAIISKVMHNYFSIKSTYYSDNVLIILLRNYGADLLWSASFTLIVQSIILFDKKRSYLLLLSNLLGVIYELMQRFGIATGTADILDVIVYIIGSLLAIIIIQGGNLYEEK